MDIQERKWKKRMDRKEKMKELTLLLLYLTSWEEKEGKETFLRSWKGYPFEILDELTEKDMIYGSKRAKSIGFTDEGERIAKDLEKSISVKFIHSMVVIPGINKDSLWYNRTGWKSGWPFW